MENSEKVPSGARDGCDGGGTVSPARTTLVTSATVFSSPRPLDDTPPTPTFLPAPPPPTPTRNEAVDSPGGAFFLSCVDRKACMSYNDGAGTTLVEQTCDLILRDRNHPAIDLSNNVRKLPFDLVNIMFNRLVARNQLTDALCLMLLRPRLRSELHIRACHYLRKSVIRQALFHCHQLTSLDLGQCTQVNNIVLRAALQASPSLKVLRVDDCKSLTDAAFHQDMSLFSPLNGLLCLEELDISGCNQLTDRVLTQLAKFSSELRVFVMARCKGISSVGVQDILYAITSLESINVSFCPRVTDEAFDPLLMKRRSLQHIYADNCNIGDKTLSYIARGCKHMRTVTLRWCHGVTDEGVRLLAHSCHEIESIDISSCYEVTDTAVNALSKSCKSLRTLDVSFCSKVTLQGLEHAEKIKSFANMWCNTKELNASVVDRADSEKVAAENEKSEREVQSDHNFGRGQETE